MTYRSESEAFSFELEELETALHALEAQFRELEHTLAQRRLARRGRQLRAYLAVAMIGAVLFAATRHGAHRSAAQQAARERADAEAEIALLEQEVAPPAALGLAPDEPRPSRSRRGAEIAHDPKLYEVIRTLNPTEPPDAWWIVAHARCREQSEAPSAETLVRLTPERRKRVLAFCAGNQP